jgi:hypothetical protein
VEGREEERKEGREGEREGGRKLIFNAEKNSCSMRDFVLL